MYEIFEWKSRIQVCTHFGACLDEREKQWTDDNFFLARPKMHQNVCKLVYAIFIRKFQTYECENVFLILYFFIF